jgi:hypothetical protein
VSHANLPPLVLWPNRQTEACLVLRPKPRNHRGDFEAQITIPELPVLRPNSRNRRPWFWGSTKKSSLLISMCTVQTTHSITRPPDRPATEYLICAWPSPVLCTRSPTPTMILVAACHVAPVTYTPQDKETRFFTWTKIKGNSHWNVPDSNSNLDMSMTHHISNQGTDHLVSQSSPWWVHWQQKAQSLNLESKTPWSSARRPKAKKLKKVIQKKEKSQGQQKTRKAGTQAKWQEELRKAQN